MDFNLKDVLDLGGQGVLLFLLWQVWQRLTLVTDILINDRIIAQADRKKILGRLPRAENEDDTLT